MMESEKVLELIEVTLAIGNYLNGQTAKGGASGFKIDIVEKAADVKGNSMSLLKYIVLQCKKRLEEGDLQKVEILKSVSVQQLWSDLNEMKKGALVIKKAIESKMDDGDLVEEYLSKQTVEIDEEALKEVEE